MNEKEFIDKLKVYGYKVKIEFSENNEINYVYIYPLGSFLSGHISNLPIDFLLRNGFIIDYIEFNYPYTRSYICFYNLEKKIKKVIEK